MRVQPVGASELPRRATEGPVQGRSYVPVRYPLGVRMRAIELLCQAATGVPIRGVIGAVRLQIREGPRAAVSRFAAFHTLLR